MRRRRSVGRVGAMPERRSGTRPECRNATNQPTGTPTRSDATSLGHNADNLRVR